MLEVIVLSRILLRCHCGLCGFWPLGCLSSPSDVWGCLQHETALL